jgi:hypothetical protein
VSPWFYNSRRLVAASRTTFQGIRRNSFRAPNSSLETTEPLASKELVRPRPSHVSRETSNSNLHLGNHIRLPRPLAMSIDPGPRPAAHISRRSQSTAHWTTTHERNLEAHRRPASIVPTASPYVLPDHSGRYSVLEFEAALRNGWQPARASLRGPAPLPQARNTTARHRRHGTRHDARTHVSTATCPTKASPTTEGPARFRHPANSYSGKQGSD